jgi:hypothetical protein
VWFIESAGVPRARFAASLGLDCELVCRNADNHHNNSNTHERLRAAAISLTRRSSLLEKYRAKVATERGAHASHAAVRVYTSDTITATAVVIAAAAAAGAVSAASLR